ncbi:glycosyltransferase [Sphaerotilus mobilis]|uniref:Glycosyltransferase involved in cell wall biosynthesis n=1 Tax=Sphaerotilus mobilis TaxID=47994 RepID=A0A4Q7LCP3_9BURK|nr:glycosyltransferase [Sphaerotilus mobilis]RZS47480.1 glycosyltransferase involved in cell wall biosynthesis [Sphaerotilus mobilis]
MTNRLIVLCNALDDETRIRRGITSDSPAASRKMFMMCRSLRSVGVRPWIVSLGRGKQDGSGRLFGFKVKRINSCPVIYLPFEHSRLLSLILTLLSAIIPLNKFARMPGNTVIMFYNRMPAYLAALLFAKIRGIAAFLDIEDGEILEGQGPLTKKLTQLKKLVYASICSRGTMLACEGLRSETTSKHILCYYGTVGQEFVEKSWTQDSVHILLGGTISKETGADAMIQVLDLIERRRPLWSRKLTLEISGKGDLVAEFSQRAGKDIGMGGLVIHGRTTDEEYQAIVRRCQVGLALKPATGQLANTTFPSKVIEMASAGLLLVTTDISDVRLIFGESAVYVHSEDPESIYVALQKIVSSVEESSVRALHGQAIARSACDSSQVGPKLKQFFFNLPK